MPVLVRVTVCAALAVFKVWLAKVRLELERLTAGAVAFAPVPVRVIVCGEPAALSAMVTEAVRVPVAVGVNVTLMVQLPLFAATVLPQVVVSA